MAYLNLSRSRMSAFALGSFVFSTRSIYAFNASALLWRALANAASALRTKAARLCGLRGSTGFAIVFQKFARAINDAMQRSH